MLSEWTAECQSDAPRIEVPWSDTATGLHFINLRAEPYDLPEVHEADRYPALQRSLRSLNAPRSPVLTSKCDVWFTSPEELNPLQLELDLDPDHSACGISSYIDILWRERRIFASAHLQQQRLDRFIRRAERLPHPEVALHCVLRPAMYSLQTPLEGFAVTLYLHALAHDRATAISRWSSALEDVTALLREGDLNTTQASATIDAAPRAGE